MMVKVRIRRIALIPAFKWRIVLIPILYPVMILPIPVVTPLEFRFMLVMWIVVIVVFSSIHFFCVSNANHNRQQCKRYQCCSYYTKWEQRGSVLRDFFYWHHLLTKKSIFLSGLQISFLIVPHRRTKEAAPYYLHQFSSPIWYNISHLHYSQGQSRYCSWERRCAVLATKSEKHSVIIIVIILSKRHLHRHNRNNNVNRQWPNKDHNIHVIPCHFMAHL